MPDFPSFGAVRRPFVALGLGLLAFALLATGASRAEPPEVTNVRLDKPNLPDNPDCIIWDIQDGCGYHVYRGDLSTLTSDYGTCLVGTVPGDRAEIPEDPPPGEGFFYLVTAVEPAGEGTAGSRTDTTERIPTTACVPARRIFEATPDGDPGDGVEDGQYPLRNPSVMTRTSPREVSGVYLHSGEFTLGTADLVIPGRGLDWAFTRTYRSQMNYDGPLGHNWDSNVNARLVPLGTDVRYFDGSGRRDRFFRIDSTRFDSSPGRYAVLRENDDGSFTLREPHGALQHFHAFDGSNLQGVIEAIEDRNGNRITFQYDHQALLVGATDTMGRAIVFSYDPAGRLTAVTDFSDRTCELTYDTAGDLVAVRTPTVIGTPNGNDFPAGKSQSYSYSSGLTDPRLVHCLLDVTNPNEQGSGPPAMQIEYFTDTAPAFDRGRVAAWTIGGTNSSGIPAGGTLSFAYEALNAGGDPNDPALPRRRTTVADRNGNLRQYVHNHPGNRISLTRLTNREVRPGEPDYTTEWDYSADGEVVEVRRSEGNRIRFTYDTPGLDRYREGNLLEKRRIADSIALGGRGDGHGGEAADIVWSYTYEPLFNRLASSTEPRGNDPGYVPQNGGVQSAARYTTSSTFDYQEGDPATNGVNALAGLFEIDLTTASLNLGDRNGDGRTDQASGNLVRVDSPGVLLDPASNQAAIEGDTSQQIVTLRQWNYLGQLTAMIDAELNRHEFVYHAENDPDGDGTPTPAPPDGRMLDGVTGGYVATRLTDTISDPNRNNKTNPAPAAIREDYQYDDVGNLTHRVDGRGVLTRRVYNELDQVVEVRRAAATADVGGPDGDPATGRGETGLTPFGFKVHYEYDANDNRVALRVEDRDLNRGVGAFVDTTYAYDILDRRLSETRETTTTNSLTTQYRYDANENLTRVIEPAGNSHEYTYDERDLLHRSTRGATGPRGGLPAIRSRDYDGNRNEIRLEDARGNQIDLLHDGFDRLARVVDQVGNTVDLFHDPADNRIRELARGPVAGPTPSDRSGSTNVDLADVEYRYDELSRVIRIDHELFVPAGAAPGRPPELAEGPLIPGDGFVNQALEHDRLSRNTFAIRDSGATWRYDHDGAGRSIKTTAPDGSLTESFHDGNDNLVESAETELSSSPSVPAELFLTTYFHDALDRRSQIVDNVGQTRRILYDSLDALVTLTDANGPAGPTINRRSPTHAATTVQTNLHGNVTRYTYDGAGRRLSSERILTASGRGDGTTSPPPVSTDPNNLDGINRLEHQWDDNSLQIALVDDRGNTTTYSHDNLDRQVAMTMDDGTLHAYGYDPEDNPTQHTDANGSVFTHAYDAANRRTRTDVIPASGIEGTTQQLFQYDGLHRRTRAVDNNNPTDPTDDAELDWVYDSLGRVVEEKQTLGLSGGQKLVDYRWQAESRITDLIYPSGRRVQYGYDSSDRLTSTGDAARSETAGFDWFGMLGRWHTRSYGNGVRATMLDDSGTTDTGYDGVRRVTSLRHLSGTDVLLAGFEHGYDGTSNRLHELRLHDEDAAAGGFRGELWSFDSDNRLTTFEEGVLDPSTLTLMGPATDGQAWALDGVDNWVTLTRNGVDYRFTPSNNNEYDEAQSGGTRTDDGVPDDTFDDDATPVPDGLNQAHDKNGNTTEEGTYTLVHDAWNRPVRIVRDSDGATILESKFDALGRRVWKAVANSGDLDETRRYLYAPATPTSGPGAAFDWVKDKVGDAVDWALDKTGEAMDWPD